MNSFGAMSSEYVFEFSNKAVGSHNRCLTLQKVPTFFLIALINASISYFSRVVLLLPVVPVATMNNEEITKSFRYENNASWRLTELCTEVNTMKHVQAVNLLYSRLKQETFSSYGVL